MYVFYSLFALTVLLIIATALLGMLMLDCVNRKLPKDKQLSWWRRSSILTACQMYKDLYPKGQLSTAFWICFCSQFIVFAVMFLIRPR